MKVLLIDDDQALLTVFSTALKQDGFETLVAYTAKSGIETAKAQKPDFILLDQILPDNRGNDVLKLLKADTLTKVIPVALLSNFGQNELIEEAMTLGALDYILKYQIDPQDLSNKVKELLNESQAQQRTTNQQ